MGIGFAHFFPPWDSPSTDSLPESNCLRFENGVLQRMNDVKDSNIYIGTAAPNEGCYINDTFIPGGTEIYLTSNGK